MQVSGYSSSFIIEKIEILRDDVAVDVLACMKLVKKAQKKTTINGFHSL